MSSSNRGIVQIMGIVDISYRGKREIIVVIGISNENFLREPDSCCKSNKGQTCRHSIEPEDTKQTSDAKINWNTRRDNTGNGFHKVSAFYQLLRNRRTRSSSYLYIYV